VVALMSHTQVARLEVRHHDGREPTVYEHVSYTPHRAGVTVFVDGEQVEHREAFAVADKEPAAV
jgi:hypothetical protein